MVVLIIIAIAIELSPMADSGRSPVRLPKRHYGLRRPAAN
jgi:hypothetical protein